MSGTSYHGDTVRATLLDMYAILGQPTDRNGDKTTYEWHMETESGHVFTVYDWKEYRQFGPNERIEWHIGGHTGAVTAEAMYKIADLRNALERMSSDMRDLVSGQIELI